VGLEQAKTSKKPYEKPTLKVYGDVKTVTATAVTVHHTPDGGSKKFSKTG